jgi:hypothetical protein
LVQAAVVSTFDMDSEGWIVADEPDPGPYTADIGLYPVQYSPDGGNPGGRIWTDDPTGSTFYFLPCPAQVSG